MATDESTQLTKKVRKEIQPPFTTSELDNLVINFRCNESSCPQSGGGCFRDSFIHDGNFYFDIMISTLRTHREYTQLLSDEEKDAFCINLFKSHCSNLNEVIDSAAEVDEQLYSNYLCGTCGPSPVSYCGDNECISNNKKHTSSSSHLSYSSSRVSKKFVMDWTVKLNDSTLPNGNLKLGLCRKSVAFLYGVSENSLKSVASKMRESKTSAITSSRTLHEYNSNTYFGDLTMTEIEMIFDDNGIESNKLMGRAALIRSAQSELDATVWMEEYFNRYESQPNCTETHIDVTFKRSIWLEYWDSQLPAELEGTMLY